MPYVFVNIHKRFFYLTLVINKVMTLIGFNILYLLCFTICI